MFESAFPVILCVAVIITLLKAITCSSYVVTLPNTLPATRQIEWLKQLTSDMVSGTPPGELSQAQLSASHELIYAWSHTRFPIPQKYGNDNVNAMNHKECALQVESLLKRIVEERCAGNDLADLTVTDYNCLLEGWARSGLGEESAQRTEQILETMQLQGPTPNLQSFKACLMAWRHAKVPFAAVRAQRILEWMIRLYHSKENLNALPDSDCFDIVLQLWSRSGLDNAPKQSEQLLGTMERLFKTTGDDKLKPKITSFNAVLAAWSKAQNLDPNVASDRVMEIITFMESWSKIDPKLTPDPASYNMVMNTIVKSRDIAKAAVVGEEFVRHVVDVYKTRFSDYENRIISTKPPAPDIILFSSAIGLWAKAGTTKSYRRAHSILDRQLRLSNVTDIPVPDVFGWTSVLSSCSAESGNAEERSKAFQVGASTYRLMQKYGVEANHVTYGTMLKACARLHPIKSPLREKWLRITFKDAIQAGCVGDMVVSKLREAATPDVFKELMQGYSKKQLPPAWTMNVQEHSEYRTSTRSRPGKRAEV
jgi:hypothetical protein